MKTVKGKLQDGVKIGGKLARAFEMREATAGDMFDAEALAPANKQVTYHGALISRQLVSLGDMPGPIDFDIIRRLTPVDFGILYEAQQELEALGKSPSNSDDAGTT